ncbi:protein TonB [Paraburkholderia caballeronis]|uniref:Protein TonB n=1 Tax=Paraburkholderia caballeronis TaxID=416943 RepID=A0A1H7TFZ6_9BURK|nr:protein TonB [Paraburkholderia caballeronis]PXW95634.1 protein TonB [Paraburkholderia caballeronis]RAJ91980.1 protein TonB [Paraburkholderia caballeronis]SEL83633.1 protein TonB [Paraburkholderia caballeronis]
MSHPVPVRRHHASPGRHVTVVVAATVLAAACTITPPPRPVTGVPPAAVRSAALDRYRADVAQRILDRNPSYVLHGAPQAMLRSLVVVAFTVDRNGRVVESSVYRTNGDDEAETTALSTLRRASPLPPPLRAGCSTREAVSN